jgi:hypothetical protein
MDVGVFLTLYSAQEVIECPFEDGSIDKFIHIIVVIINHRQHALIHLKPLSNARLLYRLSRYLGKANLCLVY